jgi:hypothetical protein
LKAKSLPNVTRQTIDISDEFALNDFVWQVELAAFREDVALVPLNFFQPQLTGWHVVGFTVVIPDRSKG